jgi:hypothetical protein
MKQQERPLFYLSLESDRWFTIYTGGQTFMFLFHTNRQEFVVYGTADESLSDFMSSAVPDTVESYHTIASLLKEVPENARELVLQTLV